MEAAGQECRSLNRPEITPVEEWGLPASSMLWGKGQKIKIRTEHLHTLHGFQKLLWDINWLKPYLKYSIGELQPLIDILKGDSDPLSVRILTTEPKQALELVNQAIQNQLVKYVNYDFPIILIICKTEILPTGLLWQEGPLL